MYLSYMIKSSLMINKMSNPNLLSQKKKDIKFRNFDIDLCLNHLNHFNHFNPYHHFHKLRREDSNL